MSRVVKIRTVSSSSAAAPRCHRARGIAPRSPAASAASKAYATSAAVASQGQGKPDSEKYLSSLAERLKFIQNAAGAILGPFDSWLVLRGVKTLAVRMAKHNENGLAIARHLEKHPKVQKVYYPGLPSHPQHALAKKQMTGFGGMLAFETGSLENARTLLKSVRLCSLAESLGGVETLISHPATMTHASVPAEERNRLGITDGLVRVSVGIEDVEDLIADLDQALKGI